MTQRDYSETPRPLTRGEQRRARARAEAWASAKERWRVEAELGRADGQDWQAAVAAGQVRNRDAWNHLLHFGLVLITGGVWLPVWLWVAVRDHRRVARTGPGQRAKQRRREAEMVLRETRRRRRAVERATR